MFYCYILFSKKLDRFYVGSTSLSPKIRLERHLNQYYGKNKFTANANDWVLFLEIKCSSINQSLLIEKHIKKMKSKIYIRNLSKYEEMISNLKQKYIDC